MVQHIYEYILSGESEFLGTDISDTPWALPIRMCPPIDVGPTTNLKVNENDEIETNVEYGYEY